MNARLLSEAISQIDDKYYQEAASYQGKRHRWAKFISLAACAAIVAAVSAASLQEQLPEQTVPEGNTPIVSDPGSHPDHTGPAIQLMVNEIGVPNTVTNNIALLWDDYTPIPYEELLAYFDVSLPITETLPDFTLQSKNFGIFQSEDSKVYFDGNLVVFRNSDGTQSISITLSKVFKHTFDVFELTGDELQFTGINGRELAVFHYTSDSGADCYYTEFLQNDVAFLVCSENVSPEDYAVCLQALVEKKQQGTGPVQPITGRISAVDPYANYIGIFLDEEEGAKYSCGYGIHLPDGESAESYSLGGRVAVTYTGEPATICTIWAEQLVDIELLP